MAAQNGNCDVEAGKLIPIVNFSRCEGKEDCAIACPYDVFEIRPLALEDRAQLNFVGRLKTLFNKNKAYVVNPQDCHACGLCVTSCPEKAIQLRKANG